MYKPRARVASLELRRQLEKLLDAAGADGLSTPSVSEALGGMPLRSTIKHLQNMHDAGRAVRLNRVQGHPGYRWYAPEHKPSDWSYAEPTDTPEGNTDSAPDDNMHQLRVAANAWRIDHPTSPASVFDLGNHINRSAA